MSFAFRRAFTLTRMVFVPLMAAVSCGGTTTPSADLDASGASGGPANDGGAGAGGAGAGGAGGAADASSTDVDAICKLPRESGNCDAYIPSYWHNPTTGVCEPFAYGGCGGNANRFASLDECQAACHGGSPEFDSCRDPGDCTLIAVGCCGNCGREVAHDFIAVNYSAANKYPRECNGTCGQCPNDIPEKDLTGQDLDGQLSRGGLRRCRRASDRRDQLHQRSRLLPARRPTLLRRLRQPRFRRAERQGRRASLDLRQRTDRLVPPSASRPSPRTTSRAASHRAARPWSRNRRSGAGCRGDARGCSSPGVNVREGCRNARRRAPALSRRFRRRLRVEF